MLTASKLPALLIRRRAITGYYGTYTVSNCTANSFQYTALVSGLANGGNGVASGLPVEVTAVNKATGIQGGETIPSATGQRTRLWSG